MTGYIVNVSVMSKKNGTTRNHRVGEDSEEIIKSKIKRKKRKRKIKAEKKSVKICTNEIVGK